MKNSQKGTKLNEARYFRQPRPYTRKRITRMRLIPDFSELHGSVNSSLKDRPPSSPFSRTSGRSTDRCVTLDRDQRSMEIARISYTSDSEDTDFFIAQARHRDRWRDSFAETDPEREIVVSLPEAADRVPKEPEVGRLEVKHEAEKEVQVELEIKMEERRIERDRAVEEPKPEVSEKPEVADATKETWEAKEPEDRHEKSEIRASERGSSDNERGNSDGERSSVNERGNSDGERRSSDSERSIWWRYGGIRRILDFFGNLLGRRASGENEKEAKKTDDAKPVEKGIESPTSTEKSNKRSSSPVKGRTKRSLKRKAAAARKNVSTEQPHDRTVTGLTRQIINTRDKRLRAALLEHEMRTRKLEEENRRYRRILEDKLKTRQMSSPLH